MTLESDEGILYAKYLTEFANASTGAAISNGPSGDVEGAAARALGVADARGDGKPSSKTTFLAALKGLLS